MLEKFNLEIQVLEKRTQKMLSQTEHIHSSTPVMEKLTYNK